MRKGFEDPAACLGELVFVGIGGDVGIGDGKPDWDDLAADTVSGQ